MNKFLKTNLLAFITLSVGLLSCSSDEPKDDNKENSGSSSKLKYEAVDLGLSVKWATCNVGASKPSGLGDYFCWGEVEKKEVYGECVWYDVKYDDLLQKGVIDQSGNLTSKYDAATVNCGNDWRMPTRSELDELMSKCTGELTEIDGVKGVKLIGPNGNSIFLPASGMRDKQGSSAASGKVYAYWSSTACQNSYESYVYMLNIIDPMMVDFQSEMDRFFGMPVRAVKK